MSRQVGWEDEKIVPGFGSKKNGRQFRGVEGEKFLIKVLHCILTV